jgi:hypothetical protein
MGNVTFGEVIAYQDRERERKREFEAKRGKRDRPERRKSVRRFAGFDGEGWDVGGKHSLMILRAGESEIYTGKPLLLADVFDWMVQLPRDVYYVGFSLGYDLSMLLGQLPKERFRKLYDRESRTRGERGFMSLPVDWRETYRMDWIPGKRFSVWLADDPRKRFDVEDVVGCFQKSFLASIRDWEVGTPDEVALIERFKSLRATFEDEDVGEVREYNRLECVLLAEMMERVRTSANDSEIHPTSWYGAGQLAQAVMRSRNVKANMRAETFPDEFERAADAAYFGGWFDTSRVGIFPGVYEYDIGSAYPHAMRSLPCLAHCEVVHGAVEGAEQLVRVGWTPYHHNSPNGRLEWGAFPMRHGTRERTDPREGNRIFTPGTLWYPRNGEGWYWRREVDALDRREGYMLTILETWSVVSHCSCRPFSWVDRLYVERKRLGKSGKGKVLKLAMNSLYGKLAQSVGKPQFASIVWAGLVTSTTRAALQDAIRHAGERNVLMIATDALYTAAPIPDGRLDVGSGLGQWEAAEHGRYMIVQPGLHYAYDSEQFKTRGIPSGVVREGVERLERHWYSAERWKSFPFEITMFMSPQLSYQFRQPDLMGQWIPVQRGVKFGSADKRVIPSRLPRELPDSVNLSLLGNINGYRSAPRAQMNAILRAAKMDDAWESLKDDQRDYIDPMESVVAFSDPL